MKFGKIQITSVPYLNYCLCADTNKTHATSTTIGQLTNNLWMICEFDTNLVKMI